tara:strand:+ start:547 stop:828 length:282 start_codon:yes stop_codon:yes gene_type:complete
MLNIIETPQAKKMIMIFAAYGIVQVLAQDLGIKTGKKQRDLIQSMPVQIVLLFSGAYTVTEDVNTALIATGIYYFLKFIYSKGETSSVCFEDV